MGAGPQKNISPRHVSLRRVMVLVFGFLAVPEQTREDLVRAGVLGLFTARPEAPRTKMSPPTVVVQGRLCPKAAIARNAIVIPTAEPEFFSPICHCEGHTEEYFQKLAYA